LAESAREGASRRPRCGAPVFWSSPLPATSHYLAVTFRSSVLILAAASDSFIVSKTPRPA